MERKTVSLRSLLGGVGQPATINQESQVRTPASAISATTPSIFNPFGNNSNPRINESQGLLSRFRASHSINFGAHATTHVEPREGFYWCLFFLLVFIYLYFRISGSL